jgi:DNA-binding NarL/FixJ family response regulator
LNIRIDSVAKIEKTATITTAALVTTPAVDLMPPEMASSMLAPRSNRSPIRRIAELSSREQDVLRLVVLGLSNAEIGSELYISETTVKTHVTHILQKLNLRDRVQAVVLAYQTGLFEAE